MCLWSCVGGSERRFGPALARKHWDVRTTQDILLDVATAPASGGGAATVQSAQDAILAAVQVTPLDIKRLRGLCQRLPDGTYNPAWLAARRWRLTASSFHAVRRARRHRQLAESLLEGWWYRGTEPRQARALDFESKALRGYARRLPEDAAGGCVRLAAVGTLVAQGTPWLAASPDAMVLAADGEPLRLVEVKSQGLAMRAGCPAWAQVQGAMAIASGSFDRPVHRCAVITPKEVYSVRFDAQWWQAHLQRLRDFYFGAFLPVAAQQIVDRATGL